jgi:hypothetical protein
LRAYFDNAGRTYLRFTDIDDSEHGIGYKGNM